MKSSVWSLIRFAKHERIRPDFQHQNTMDRFLFLILLFVVCPFAMQQEVDEGPCKCAVFPVEIQKLIMERTLRYNVTCDSEGDRKCQQLCVALAESARDKAPQMICEKLNVHVENLQVGVYAKICYATAWKFTGLKSAEQICCHGGNSTPCKEPVPVIDD